MVDLERFRKQILLEKIGKTGQEKLADSRALVVGCGALGTVICNNLTRMGIGSLVIVDRDFIERDNLHRQILFDEDDITQNLPKAVAAARKLQRINPQVKIDAHVTDINSDNILEMMNGVNCVIDGTDNFETRYLINDACWKLGIPWIYGGVTGTGGMFYTFYPPETPCLRCFMPEPPALGETETCDTVGVMPTAVSIAASFETTEAIKILTGQQNERVKKMVRFDAWDASWISFGLAKNPECPLCRHNHYDFLDANLTTKTVSLCGRNAMQIIPAKKTEIDFAALAKRLSQSGKVEYNDYILKFTVDDIEISLFKDSRAIIKGLTDEAAVRTVFSKYIGL